MGEHKQSMQIECDAIGTQFCDDLESDCVIDSCLLLQSDHRKIPTVDKEIEPYFKSIVRAEAIECSPCRVEENYILFNSYHPTSDPTQIPTQSELQIIDDSDTNNSDDDNGPIIFAAIFLALVACICCFCRSVFKKRKQSKIHESNMGKDLDDYANECQSPSASPESVSKTPTSVDEE